MWKAFAFGLCLVVGASYAARPELDEEWELFKTTFEKAYETDEEETSRRGIWEELYDVIQQHNEEYLQGVHTYSLGQNAYADMSHEEFLAVLLPGFPGLDSLLPEDAAIYSNPVDVRDLPASVDWRPKGVVTPVKDQKQCGSCWAFSATGSMEGAHAIKTGTLVSLSEQNLVDCSAKEGNMGCFGGLMNNAFQYVLDVKGIDTEDSYPYKAEDEKCHFNAANVGTTISNYTKIQTGSDDDLLKAVAEVGPISVAMDASPYKFQLYKTGIYKPDKCSKTQLDHGVLAVGYGSDNSGAKYWIVKNSWGTSWGMDGYFLMDRDETNECGISTMSSFPTI